MKSTAKKSIIIAIIASIFCAGIFAAPAEVISVKGKVEVCRGEQWIPLKIGDKVNQSEMISTGFQSGAKIKMGDSILQLGALSRVTLETLSNSENKDVIDVYLNTGAVRSKVNHTSDKKVSYTVRNPIAVASVRGTDFTYADSGIASCSEGAIALSSTRYYEESDLAKSDDDADMPADGESDASTPATDISPSAPKGSIVVLAGQVAIISSNGSTTTPFAAAKNNVQKAASAITTAAESEAISTAPVVPTQSSVTSASSASATSTGTLIVTPSFETAN